MGYGSWSARYWFVGMEPGGSDDRETYASWLRLGGTDLIDLRAHNLDWNGRRQLSWPVEGRGRKVPGWVRKLPTARSNSAQCPAKGSPTTKCSRTRLNVEGTAKPLPLPRLASASAVPADSKRSSRCRRNARRGDGAPARIRLRTSGRRNCCRSYRRSRI